MMAATQGLSALEWFRPEGKGKKRGKEEREAKKEESSEGEERKVLEGETGQQRSPWGRVAR